MKVCYRCGKEWSSLTKKQPGVKELCPQCNAYLHCCKNCKWYMPGKPNDCYIPNTDKVANKEGANFCDFFEFKEGNIIRSDWDNQREKAKRDFDNLFKDL